MASRNGRKRERRGGKNGRDAGDAVEAFMLNKETQRGPVTLLLLVLGILFSLAAFSLAGAIGVQLDTFSRDLLGVLYPLLPLFLFFLVLSRLRGKAIGLDAAVKFGAGLFIIMLASLIHLMVSRP